MRKKRSDSRTEAFRTSPFKGLKGFAPKATPPPAPPGRPDPMGEEDEAALFLGAMGGARRISGSADAESGPPDRGQPPDRTEEDADRSNAALFLSAMGTIGTASFRDEDPDQEAETSRRSSSSRMRQLKRGAIRIGQELDLHGFLREEAIRRLELFIAAAAARGQQAVLVITGKGINSPEGPVLQGAVESWLRQKSGGLVAEFQPAPRDKGGSGAFVVFLKKK